MLDEATSSLDADTAQQVLDAVWQALSSCTLIVIAHSMRTVLQCDRVLVIDSGQVVISQSLVIDTLIDHIHEQKYKQGVKKPTVVHNAPYNNRVHGQKLRLDINFLTVFSRSSLGS